MHQGMLARIAYGSACILVTVLLSATAKTETLLTGSRADLRIAITDASVAEVLAALEAKFDVNFRARAPLDHHVSGSYSGSLQSVVSRILNGYDFIIKTEAEHLEVIVIGVTNQKDTTIGRTNRRSD
jgi:hypothetical protein